MTIKLNTFKWSTFYFKLYLQEFCLLFSLQRSLLLQLRNPCKLSIVIFYGCSLAVFLRKWFLTEYTRRWFCFQFESIPHLFGRSHEALPVLKSKWVYLKKPFKCDKLTSPMCDLGDAVPHVVEECQLGAYQGNHQDFLLVTSKAVCYLVQLNVSFDLVASYF